MCLVKNHNEESRILDVIDKITGLICVGFCNSYLETKYINLETKYCDLKTEMI